MAKAVRERTKETENSIQLTTFVVLVPHSEPEPGGVTPPSVYVQDTDKQIDRHRDTVTDTCGGKEKEKKSFDPSSEPKGESNREKESVCFKKKKEKKEQGPLGRRSRSSYPSEQVQYNDDVDNDDDGSGAVSAAKDGGE